LVAWVSGWFWVFNLCLWVLVSSGSVARAGRIIRLAAISGVWTPFFGRLRPERRQARVQLFSSPKTPQNNPVVFGLYFSLASGRATPWLVGRPLRPSVSGAPVAVKDRGAGGESFFHQGRKPKGPASGRLGVLAFGAQSGRAGHQKRGSRSRAPTWPRARKSPPSPGGPCDGTRGVPSATPSALKRASFAGPFEPGGAGSAFSFRVGQENRRKRQSTLG